MMKYTITTALFIALLSALQAQIGIELNLQPGDCFCEGTPQQLFSVTAEGNAGPFTYEWSSPNGYSSTAKEPDDIVLAGEYTLEVYNAYACSFTYSVVLEACPGPTFQFNTTPASPTCPGQITLEDIIGPDTYTSYEWYNEAGDLLPDNQGLTLENAAAGSYYMVAISEAGCRFSSPMVEVEGLQDLQVIITSQTAACNGQATGDFAIVPDNAFRVSSVFPNPFSQQLTIKLTASYAGNAQVNLVNLLGQVVHTERHEFVRGYTPIQVSTAALGLTPGLYQVVVTDELGNYYTEKIMYQP